MTHPGSPISRRTLVGSGLSCFCLPVLLVGCGGRQKEAEKPAEAPLPEYRGPLVNPATMRVDFVWEQRVTAFHAGDQGAFDAVVQKQGEELLVLGLTPFRTRGFALTQKGAEHHYEQFVPFKLPFDPKAVLIDIHRAFFYSLPDPFPAAATRKTPYESEVMVDRFAQSALVERTYENLLDTGKRLAITYEAPGYRRYHPSRRTILDNQAYGYRLEVETTSVTFLD